MRKKEVDSLLRVLAVEPDASEEDIDKAYEQARELYGNDSPALYSLYSSEQREAKLGEIDRAYRSLKKIMREGKERQEKEGKIGNTKKVVETADKEFSVINLGEQAGSPVSADCKHVAFKKKLIVMDDANPLVSEQYRILFSRLEEVSVTTSKKTFAVTSSVKGEGKTVTAVNFAYMLSHEFEKRVLLVEGDLKKASISTDYLSELSDIGLVDVLKGKADWRDAIVQLEKSNLFILPAGSKVKNSVELLASGRMQRMLDRVKMEFDFIIVDCPPIVPLADINVLSKMVDGLLVVVRAGKTHKNFVKKAIESVTGSEIVGIILNRSDASYNKYYYSYYYH